MSVVSPALWKSLQFGDQNAFVDWLGHHDLWHIALDDVVRRMGGAPYPTLPLGDGPIGDGASDWHFAHQRRHEGLCSGLAIPGPPDFTAYDLNQRDDFNTYTWLHAVESERVMSVLGGLV
jgi:hypothetical protein